MTYIEVLIKQFITDCTRQLNLNEAILKTMPWGHLTKAKNNGKDRYYQTDYSNNTRMRKTVSTEELLAELLRKEFLAEKKTILEKQKTILEDALNHMPETCDEEQIINRILEKRFPNADKDLIDQIRFGKTEKQSWMNAPYQQSDFKPELKRFNTSFGLKVRSKSELIIAELLHSLGVAFRYEEVLKIGNITYAPDFTIMRDDGSIIYWEHFGLIGNIGYYDRQLSKLRVFYGAGIVPWKNLIISYDDENGVIDAATVMNLIQTRILL